MRRILLLLAMCMGISLLCFSQTSTVTGTVTNEAGAPVPYATVAVKGSVAGVSANENGEFSINAKEGAILVFSATGYGSLELAVNGSVVNAVLKMDKNEIIEEVVITAVGVKRAERSLGYAATQINADEITATGNRSALNALQGKVPGVEISSASGAPGASTRVIMRGFSSLGGSNQPLYVVDGVPVSNGQIGTDDLNGGLDFGNRGNDINPNDIESISILQGGSAAALYGSRAASGVIIITTKNGSRSN